MRRCEAPRERRVPAKPSRCSGFFDDACAASLSFLPRQRGRCFASVASKAGGKLPEAYQLPLSDILRFEPQEVAPKYSLPVCVGRETAVCTTAAKGYSLEGERSIWGYMARSEIRCWIIIAALLPLFGSAAAGGAAAPLDSCSLIVEVPQDGTVYAHLAVAWSNRVHLTCPINTHKQNHANIFVLRAVEICSGSTLFGYPVIARHMLTEEAAQQSYGICSGVVFRGRHETKTTQRTTYIWTSTLKTEEMRDRQLQQLFGKVSGGLISSGLPVDNFVSANGALCFEVDDEYPTDPLTAVRNIGVDVPSSIRQTNQPNSSCWTLLHAGRAPN